MHINLIIILVFLSLMVLVAFLYRNSTLKKLAVLPGEELLFEETERKIIQAGSPRSTRFNNCIVRVTNRRIITAQKVLMRNMHVLRHVITYNEYSDDTDLGRTLLKGYLIIKINKSQVRVERGTEKSLVRIEIPNSALTRGQYMEFKTEFPEQYEKIFM